MIGKVCMPWRLHNPPSAEPPFMVMRVLHLLQGMYASAKSYMQTPYMPKPLTALQMPMQWSYYYCGASYAGLL